MTTTAGTILLVEDFADTALFLQLLLSRHGFDIRIATTVADAIEALDSIAFTLLVSDIRLPDGTGHEIMRHARAVQPILHGIAMSADDSTFNRTLVAEAGFSRFFAKPLDMRGFLQAIRELNMPGQLPTAATSDGRSGDAAIETQTM